MLLNIITLAAFLVLFLGIFLVGDILARRREARYVPSPAGEPGTSSEGSDQSRNAGFLLRVFANVIPQSRREIEKIEYELKRAGYYRSTALVEYLGTRNALIVGVLIASITLAVLADPGTPMPEVMLGVGVLAAMLGYGLPRLVLHRQAQRRVARIQNGLPDALDLVAMCLTGGVPLPQSLERVSRELRQAHPDVAVEFEIIRRQAEADSMTGALRQFARRIDAQAVNAMAALVSQTERLGTNVSTAVSDYADSVRLARRQRAEESASKTSIKMLFPVILCLAPPVFILLIGPPSLKLYRFVKSAHEEGGILNPETLSSPEPLRTEELEDLIGTSPPPEQTAPQDSPFEAAAQPDLLEENDQ